jgi:hypothetical protein
VGVGIRQWTKAIIIFLARSIPEGQLDVLAVDLDIGNVVLKNGGNVDLGESALGEDNEKTGFATGTIADNDELAADLSHGIGVV